MFYISVILLLTISSPADYFSHYSSGVHLRFALAQFPQDGDTIRTHNKTNFGDKAKFTHLRHSTA
jgi:hypothetical protein